jgi:putative nucleotidyltransferase with HDIG domain
MQNNVLVADQKMECLSSIQSMLQDQHDQWRMTFVRTGEEAVDALRYEDFDVILSYRDFSDMRGVDLVQAAQRISPDCVRFVLTSPLCYDATLRAIPEAHQIVLHPADPLDLEKTIRNACRLRHDLCAPSMKRLLDTVKDLPALPRLYAKLTTLLRDSGSGAEDVAEPISRDVGMTAMLLKHVNSAFYGLNSTISTIRQAVAYLGFTRVKSLVLSEELFKRRDWSMCPPGINPEILQQHAYCTAWMASAILEDDPRREDAFTAGLLHDVGKLILANRLPRQMERALKRSAAGECGYAKAEMDEFGVGHAEIGAYVMMKWGLPYFVVEAVARHHHPEKDDAPSFNLVAAVHVANALVAESEVELGLRTPYLLPPLNHGLLDALDVSGGLQSWRTLADELCRNGQDTDP